MRVRHSGWWFSECAACSTAEELQMARLAESIQWFGKRTRSGPASIVHGESQGPPRLVFQCREASRRGAREKETRTRARITVPFAIPSRPLIRWHLACTKSLRSFLGFPRCHPRTGLTDSKSSVLRVVGRKSPCNSNRTAKELLPIWHFWELPFM